MLNAFNCSTLAVLSEGYRCTNEGYYLSFVSRRRKRIARFSLSPAFLSSASFFNAHARSMRCCSYLIALALLEFAHLTASKQIPLIGLFTSTNRDSRSSSAVIDYAVNHLRTIHNLTTELLIQRSEHDIPCDRAEGTKMVFDMIDRKPRPLAIFSGSCQTVASAIAETAGIYSLTTVGAKESFFRIDTSL